MTNTAGTGQRFNAFNMSDGSVQVHAVGCSHKAGSGKNAAQVQDQVDKGEREWFSQEEYAYDYWNNGILDEYEADNGKGSFDVFQEMDFKPCVTIPMMAEKSPLYKIVAESGDDYPKEGTTVSDKTEETKAPVGKAPNEVPPPRSSKSKALPGGKCRCGCGKEVGRASTFAQGHDARWVSNLVAAVTKKTIEAKDALTEAGEISAPLQAKLGKALENAGTASTRKDENSAKKAVAKLERERKAAEKKEAAAKAKAKAAEEAAETDAKSGDLDLDESSAKEDEDDDF